MTTVTTVFTCRLLPEHMESYYVELPFRMPPAAAELHVELTIVPGGSGSCVVDLGVADSHRMRGWSGGARSSFRIGSEKATPGYMAGPLYEGEWAVVLGAYRIPTEGCDVTATIRIEEEHERWLKGDLHSHSVHSDGSYTLEENVLEMERLGCDFLAMTDHNTARQNEAFPRDAAIVLIPGLELTTNRGHGNLLGAVDPLRDFRARNAVEVRERLDEGRRSGARVVLNHPFCPNTGWRWWDRADYEWDWVEVWNGPWREANELALAWWHEQLCLGRRLPAVGGSDVHRPDRFVRHARPTTWAYCRSRTARGVLEAIDGGRAFLSFDPDGPTLGLTCGDAMMGDVVQAHDGEPLLVTLAAEKLQSGDIVSLLSERGVEREATAEEATSCLLAFDACGRKFVRAEVRRYFAEVERTLMAAMSNPLYIAASPACSSNQHL